MLPRGTEIRIPFRRLDIPVAQGFFEWLAKVVTALPQAETKLCRSINSLRSVPSTQYGKMSGDSQTEFSCAGGRFGVLRGAG